jgi:hypothetical protein
LSSITNKAKYKEIYTLEEFFGDKEITWDIIRPILKFNYINKKYLDEYENKYDAKILASNFLDLSKVYCVIRKKSDTMIRHIITEVDVTKYNISKSDLEKYSRDNMEYDRCKRIATYKEFSSRVSNPFYAISKPVPNSMLMAVGGGLKDGAYFIEDEDKYGNENILISFSKDISYGGSYQFMPSTLREVSNRFRNNDFYIIPMSIHETMFVNKKYVTDDMYKNLYETEQDLLDMLEDVNDNADWRDIMSYNIYYYSKDNCNIFMIKKKK